MLRRALPRVAVLISGVALGAAGWWALSTVFLAPATEEEEAPAPTVEVTQDTVGRSLSLAAEAVREREPLPATTASGRITSLSDDPTQLEAGDVAFEVDLRPVVAAEGSIPSFRDLEAGVAGEDVRQLQDLLNSLGHETPADGEFGRRTATAVRAWQEDLGVERTGVVPSADVLFVPDLPVMAVAADDRTVGDSAEPGMTLLDVVSSAPRFSIQISSEQTDLVPLDAAVVVDPSGAAWEARIAERTAGTGPDEGSIDLRLEGTEGPVCPSPCEDVTAIEGAEVFPSDVVVVADTTGPVVPVSALQITEDSSASVVLASGDTVSVTVLAQAQGRAVIEGVAAGDHVRVFGDHIEDDSG